MQKEKQMLNMESLVPTSVHLIYRVDPRSRPQFDRKVSDMIFKMAQALTINATAAQVEQDKSLQNATDRMQESGIAESRLYADERYERVVNKEELRLMRESEANEQSGEAGNAPADTQQS